MNHFFLLTFIGFLGSFGTALSAMCCGTDYRVMLGNTEKSETSEAVVSTVPA